MAEMLPLVDAQGAPVMISLPLRGDDGNPVLDEGGQPKMGDPVAQFYSNPVMEDVTVTRDLEPVLVPDLDESGQAKFILGVRYDELAQFVMAGLAARLAALEAV